MCGPPRKGAWPAAVEVPPAGWWSSEGGDGVERAGESWWWWCGGGGSWAFEYLGFVEQPGEYWGPRGRAPPAAPDTDPDPRHAHSHSLELLVVRRQVLLVALQGQRGGGQDSGCRLGRVEGAGGGAAGQAVGGGRGQALPTG